MRQLQTATKYQGAGVKCGMRSAEKCQHVKCGEGAGLTLQFTCMNARRPHDNHEPGDAWAWDNRRCVMKHQKIRFTEAHEVTQSRSAKEMSQGSFEMLPAKN